MKSSKCIIKSITWASKKMTEQQDEELIENNDVPDQEINPWKVVTKNG